MQQATHKTSKELREDHKRAMETVRRLQAEASSLPARLREASHAAAQRRLEGSVSDSGGTGEVSALLARERELPYEIHAARVQAARLELDRVHAEKREHQAAADDLAESEELAFDGKEEATRYWKDIKAERSSHSSRVFMLDYDLRRAMDAVDRVEANAPDVRM